MTTRGLFFNCITNLTQDATKKKEDFPTIGEDSLCKYMYNIFCQERVQLFLFFDWMSCTQSTPTSIVFWLIAGHIQALNEHVHPTKKISIRDNNKKLLTYIYSIV